MGIGEEIREMGATAAPHGASGGAERDGGDRARAARGEAAEVGDEGAWSDEDAGGVSATDDEEGEDEGGGGGGTEACEACGATWTGAGALSGANPATGSPSGPRGCTSGWVHVGRIHRGHDRREGVDSRRSLCN